MVANLHRTDTGQPSWPAQYLCISDEARAYRLGLNGARVNNTLLNWPHFLTGSDPDRPVELDVHMATCVHLLQIGGQKLIHP